MPATAPHRRPRHGAVSALIRRCRTAARSAWGPLRRCSVLAPAGLTLALAVKGLHPALPGWSCPLRALIGTPCPTCFLTRATAAALTGQLEVSMRLHAFGPLCALLLLSWSLQAIRRRRLLPLAIPASAAIAGAVLLLLYWLARLVLQFGFSQPAFPTPL